jgi:hypothetical protein
MSDVTDLISGLRQTKIPKIEIQKIMDEKLGRKSKISNRSRITN